MSPEQRSWLLIGAAVVIRLAIFVFFPATVEFLSTQVEIATPTSSFKRLKEGLFLYSRGVSPYDGGVFHQAPLLLSIFEILPAPVVYTSLDLLNAISLGKIAEHLQIASPRFTKLSSTAISVGYLFNPFTVLSCLGQSTNVFTNAAIIQATLHATTANAFEAMFALATGTYLSLYPALLLPPIVLLYQQSSSSTKKTGKSLSIILGCFLGSLGLLLASTLVLTGDVWQFLASCYGAQITVTDLTPNVGLWWYFFIEIFDAFRNFFIGVFWLHLVSYVGGLTIRLRKQPFFVITSLLGLIAIFKPYPSVSDVSLYLGFLPLYKHVLPCKSTEAVCS